MPKLPIREIVDQGISSNQKSPKLPFREIVVRGIPSDQIDTGALGLQDGCTSNVLGHGPTIRKGSFRPSSPGERIREQPCVGHLQSRLSGRQPGPHAPTPPSPAFRRSYTTSMYLATCAARTACSKAGAYLAQPGRTALRSTPLLGYLPPFASAWGRPRRHYPRPHAGKHRPHNRSPRQRRSRRHPSDSLQDRVRHRQKDVGKVARAIPRCRTGRPLRGKGRRVRNPYGRAASLLACLRTPAVGPRLRHLLYRLHTGFLDREALVDHLCASEERSRPSVSKRCPPRWLPECRPGKMGHARNPKSIWSLGIPRTTISLDGSLGDFWLLDMPWSISLIGSLGNRWRACFRK